MKLPWTMVRLLLIAAAAIDSVQAQLATNYITSAPVTEPAPVPRVCSNPSGSPKKSKS
jgi:hypothetical protein